MTAIPDATEEDFEFADSVLRTMESLSSVGASKEQSLAMIGRVLHHYQRENERLARQRDVLRKWIVSNCQGYIGGAKYILEHRTGDEWFEEREYQKVFLDAISGEGGAA